MKKLNLYFTQFKIGRNEIIYDPVAGDRDLPIWESKVITAYSASQVRDCIKKIYENSSSIKIKKVMPL